MRQDLANALKKLDVFHLILVASAIGFFYLQTFSWPLITLVLGTLLIKTFSRFVPKREDLYLKALEALEKELNSQRTDISKLNLLFGIGNVKRSQENVIKDIVGKDVNL